LDARALNAVCRPAPHAEDVPSVAVPMAIVKVYISLEENFLATVVLLLLKKTSVLQFL
jgi:hypothetical protein